VKSRKTVDRGLRGWRGCRATNPLRRGVAARTRQRTHSRSRPSVYRGQEGHSPAFWGACAAAPFKLRKVRVEGAHGLVRLQRWVVGRFQVPIRHAQRPRQRTHSRSWRRVKRVYKGRQGVTPAFWGARAAAPFLLRKDWDEGWTALLRSQSGVAGARRSRRFNVRDAGRLGECSVPSRARAAKRRKRRAPAPWVTKSVFENCRRRRQESQSLLSSIGVQRLLTSSPTTGWLFKTRSEALRGLRRFGHGSAGFGYPT
jgi:hypothetical protein